LAQRGSRTLNQKKQVRPRTITRTLRLDDELDKNLLKLADGERVSVNLLINKALRRYVEWDAYVSKFGMLSISKRLMRVLFDHLTDEQARELGRQSGKDAGPELVNFWYKKFDLENTLKAFQDLIGKYSNDFQFDYRFDGKSHVLILKHDTGLKASLYYSESVRAIFNLLGMKVETSETEDQVVATLYPHR
jgi:hypothetical protein